MSINKRKDKSPTGTTPTPVAKQQRDLFAPNVSGRKETKSLSQSTLGGKFKFVNTTQPATGNKQQQKTVTRQQRRVEKAKERAKDFPPIARKKDSNRHGDDRNRSEQKKADDEYADDPIIEHSEEAWSDVVKKGKHKVKPSSEHVATHNKNELTKLTQHQQEGRPNPFGGLSESTKFTTMTGRKVFGEDKATEKGTSEENTNKTTQQQQTMACQSVQDADKMVSSASEKASDKTEKNNNLCGQSTTHARERVTRSD